MRHYRIARSSGNDCHLWASEAEHIPHLDVVGRTWEVTMILVLMFLILQFYLLYRNNNVSNKSRTWISLIGLVCELSWQLLWWECIACRSNSAISTHRMHILERFWRCFSLDSTKKNRALPGISHTQALCMYQHPTSNEGSSDQSQTQT